MAEHTPTPWELVPSTEHHGPYIVSPWGSSLCDLYTMMGGGTSRPVKFVDADANAPFIVKCVNAHDEMVAALTGLVKSAEMLAAGEGCDDFYTDAKPEWQAAFAALAKAES